MGSSDSITDFLSMAWPEVTVWLWTLYEHLLVLKVARYVGRLQLDCTLQAQRNLTLALPQF